MTTGVGAALSEHPVPAEATGEVIAEVLDRVGHQPDLAVLTVTPHHRGALEDIVPAIAATLAPRALIGSTAVAVIGGNREVEQQPAIALWAARWDGDQTVVRIPPGAKPDDLDAGALFGTSPSESPTAAVSAHTAIVLADPFTFDGEAWLDTDITMIGGLASAANQPGGNILVANDELVTDGAVAIVLSGGTPPATLVSQGCRPVGQPVTVTAAEGNLLLSLAGQPALGHLREVIDKLSPDERRLAASGLHLGWVVNEQRTEFEPGDFLIRAVMGAVTDRDAVAVGAEVPVGAAIQFQVRDAESADQELHTLLSEAPDAKAALVFTCNGRGVRFFGSSDHDAAAVYDRFETSAIGGMFCAGEIGPVGHRNFLHGYTASILLL